VANVIIINTPPCFNCVAANRLRLQTSLIYPTKKSTKNYIAAAAQNDGNNEDYDRGGGEGGGGKWWEPIVPDRSGHDNNGCGVHLGHDDKDDDRGGGPSLSEGEEIKNRCAYAHWATDVFGYELNALRGGKLEAFVSSSHAARSFG
jgi:hypothetical protein